MSSSVSVIGFEVPLETVVGAVFVQSLEKGISFVPFSMIEEYARRVESISQRKLFVWFSRDRMRSAVDELGEMFDIVEVNGVRGVICLGDVDIERLRERFLGWLPIGVLIAFSETKVDFGLTLPTDKSGGFSGR
jgi:hypothetical protein